MTRLKDKPTNPDQYEGILCGDALAIPWRYKTPQHVTGMHLGPQDGEGSDLFFLFPLSEAQHLCGWDGRWAQCAADWRQIRLGCFGFPLPHGKRLGWAFSTQRSCVMLQDLHWDGTLVLASTGRAKKYTVSYPKKTGTNFFVVHQLRGWNISMGNVFGRSTSGIPISATWFVSKTPLPSLR